MKASGIAAVVLGAGALASAQQQPPATEVFLADFGPSGIAAVRNISNSPGYDNQPHFLPDGRTLLFASNRDGKQTDIFRYDIAADRLTQLTRTPEAEYSPTPTPDGKGFSVIRVEADGAQRLWRFDPDGGNPGIVLEQVRPVGYHVWIDDTRLGLFVLGGQGQPNTLQLADTRTGVAQVIEQRFGRSLLRRPGTSQISYIHQPQGEPAVLKALDPATRTSVTLVPVPTGSQDLAWLPDGTALMAQGTTVHRWRPGEPGWTPVAADLPPTVGTITRLAVSADGRRLAFVADARSFSP